MDVMALNGTPDEQKIAGWVANLMVQRGFVYSLNAEIELGRAELVDYFVSQGVAADSGAVEALLDRAVGANAHLLGRRDTPDGAVFWIAKRRLVELLKSPSVQPDSGPARPAATKKAMATPRPAAPKETAQRPVTRKRSASKKEAAPSAEAKADLPVTRQYQLAVLHAMHKLGGSGKAALIIEMVPSVMELPTEHQGTYARGPEGKSEEPKYIKFVHSARRFLIQQGELGSPQRGIWAITPAGVERLVAAGVIK